MKGFARSLAAAALLCTAACASATVAAPTVVPPTATVVAPTVPPMSVPPTETAPAPTALPATATTAAQPTDQGTAAPTVSVDDNGLATFTSPELGIRFTYLANVGGTAIGTQVQGDKVFVYAEGTDPAQGQFVQVFSKDASQSLPDALRAQLLTGYSDTDCLVVDAPQVNGQAPAGISYAQIDVPRSDSDTLPDLNAKAQKCPAGYVGIGGLAYFAADSQHPQQFAFFSIGQYAILSANNVPWQNTIEFLK